MDPAIIKSRTDIYPTGGNALTRWIGRSLLAMMGWKIVGEFPPEPKLIMIGLPHTSNWDLILAMSTQLKYGLKFSFMMKKEAFGWPLGALWRAMGGIPIDRSRKTDIMQQMKDWYGSVDKAWLGITPEGTRSKVGEYKTGYLRMAYATGVPVFIIGVDAPKKELVLDRIWDLTGDMETDNAAIRAYVQSRFQGINARKS